MSSIEELREKHGAREYPQSPLRMCPNCFLIDYHERKPFGSFCQECGWKSDLEFHRTGSDAAMVQIIAEVRGAIEFNPLMTEHRRNALNALSIIRDYWEWKA